MAYSVNPVTFVSVPLFIIGIACTLYLLNARDQTRATRYLAAALAVHSLAMMAVFANGIEFWGGAFWPLQDALTALAIVGMIQFVYQFPARPPSDTQEYAAVTAISGAVGGAALLYSLVYAIRFLVFRRYDAGLETAFRALLPVAYAIAFVASTRRALIVHRRIAPQRPSETRLHWVWRALRYPAVPNGRVLRDFTFALGCGLMQGAASLASARGWLTWPWDVFWTTLSLIAVILFVVSSVIEHVGTPSGIEGKLVGLALTISLTVLGVLGLVQMTSSISQTVEQQYRLTDTVRNVLVQGDAALAAPGVAYILSWDQGSVRSRTAGPRVVYVGDGGVGATDVGLEIEQAPPRPGDSPPAWRYSTEVAHLATSAGASRYETVFRYGENAVGTLHQYNGLQFSVQDELYEVGFDLSVAEGDLRRQGLVLVLMVLISSALVFAAFRYVVRVHITRPLRDLLRGVAQANTGTYDIIVPVSYPDDIGYLARSFNQLTRSIATEIHERRAAEAQVRTLNASLEMQVASRTRELAALYEIAEVASQALSQASLLETSLAYVVAALSAEAGAVYLDAHLSQSGQGRGLTDAQDLACAAQAGDRQQALVGDSLAASHPLVQKTYQGAPWLIRNVLTAAEVSAFRLHQRPAAMLGLPLVVEETVLGLMLVLGRAGHIFDLNEIALAASMADQIAMGLQATQLRERATVLEERERIARDLHDSAIQALYGLVTLTGAASLQLDQSDDDAARRTLARISDTGRQAIREIRLFIHNLNPPALEEQGLVGALHHRLSTVEGRANVEARLLTDNTIDLPLRLQRSLYQIAQEALNNTLKHAHASHVTVYLTAENGTTVLEILDDGVGFDYDAVVAAKHGGMGLRNMRQRSDEVGADFRVISQPGHGTRVRVTCPA